IGKVVISHTAEHMQDCRDVLLQNLKRQKLSTHHRVIKTKASHYSVVERVRKEQIVTTDIAVIGMAGQFPQAPSLETFWENLVAGKDCVAEVPTSRFSIEHYFDLTPNQTGKTCSKWMGVLEQVD